MPEAPHDSPPIIRIAENPIPDALEPVWLRADDGARLRAAFLPCPDARGTIIVQPG